MKKSNGYKIYKAIENKIGPENMFLKVKGELEKENIF